MYRSFLLFILFVIILSSSVTLAQERHINGYFPVNNYTNDDFKSPVQIWGGTQVEYGIYLFGNDQKIIRFNGTDWSYVQKNKSDSTYTSEQINDKPVRSIFVASDSTCYVARDNSLGIVHYNKEGEHVYTPFYYDESLKNVWSIYEDEDGKLYFVSTSDIFHYNPKNKVLNKMVLNHTMSEGIIKSSILVDNGFLINFKHTNDSVIEKIGGNSIFKYSFNSKSFSKVKVNSDKRTYTVRCSYLLHGDYYLSDYYGNIYKYDKKSNSISSVFTLENIDNEVLKVNYVHLYNGLLWAATENHGIAIYNLKGSLLRVFGDKEGIQDLNVFSFFFDKDKNLWLNLDNGISSIELSSPTSTWGRMYELEGAVEALDQIDEDLIIASRSGIFRSTKKNNRLMLPNTETINESAFDVKVFETDFGKKTLVVGYTGVHDISNSDEPADRIIKDFYAWELYQSPFNRNEILVGGEKFLGKFIIDENGWRYKEIADFEGDIIKFEFVNEHVYFGVKGDGLYSMNNDNVIKKLLFEKDVEIDESHFFLSKLDDIVYCGYSKGLLKVKGDSVVSVLVKDLSFDYTDDETDLIVHRLYSHPERPELWAFIFHETKDKDDSKKLIGYFEHDSNQELRWNSVNIKSIKRGVVYDIKFINGLLYFGSSNGLIAFDRQKLENIKKPWKVYINEMKVSDSTVLNIPEFSQKTPPINHGQPIRFSFRSASFYNGGEFLYRWRLVGLSDEWSKYEKTDYKVFDQLTAGTYTFEVQGKNYYEVESTIYKYQFTILPPWYKTWWAYLIYFTSLLIIILITTRISIYRVKQKNKLLEETVKERTKEIAKQNNVLEQQKNEIIEINEDLLSSIKYAKRIQNTILTSPEILSTYFNDFFVYYLPKDIVSGDFYWARKFGNKIIWSAVDCTGHGVPGAFVSIVGNNALVRSTNEFGLSQPAEILNKLRELVIEAFKAQGTNDVKDGMDLALTSLDLDTLELNYAGANNPLIIIRNKKIIEVKADKQPIGDFEKIEPFTNHTIQLEKGDCVYLYTDGYIDQFGGKDRASRESGGKKYKSKPFKDLLIEISDLPMKEQKEILKETFNEWRGDIDQIDDVCVFGVRV